MLTRKAKQKKKTYAEKQTLFYKKKKKMQKWKIKN